MTDDFTKADLDVGFCVEVWRILLLAPLLIVTMWSQAGGARVFADQRGRVHVVLADGHRYTVSGERGQVGIEAPETASDGKTVGWLVDYSNEGERSPEAGLLIIFREGKVIRRFDTRQIFWSWAFYAKGRQVAYHAGPAHGDTFFHCELHNLKTGLLVAQWNGDGGNKKGSIPPDWAGRLNH